MTDDRPRPPTYTATQIYAALQALGHAPVLDPDIHPDGPREQDRQKFLGFLLSIADLALMNEPAGTLAEVNKAYARQAIAGPSGDTAMIGMLTARFNQLHMFLDSDEVGPVINAARQNASATAALLRLWLLTRVGPDIDTDGEMMCHLLKQAVNDVESAHKSLKPVRRQLAKHGINL